MKFKFFFSLTILYLVAFALTPCRASESWLPPRYSDNMVIPKDRDVSFVFECEQSGDAYINFNGKLYRGEIINGLFWATLPKQGAYGGPYELTISAGNKSQTIRNVWVGEVLFFSGQSNMEFPCKDLRPKLNHIPESKSHISFFKVQSSAPQTTWILPKKGDISDISAIAFLSSMEISNTLGIPIGVICSAVGGSRIEEWIDPSLERKKNILHETTLKNIADGKRTRALLYENSTFKQRFIKNTGNNINYNNINIIKEYFDTQKNKIEKLFPYLKYNYKIIPSKDEYNVIQSWTSKTGFPHIRSEYNLLKTGDYPFNALIWYQGESNANDLRDAKTYKFLLNDFIKGIRLRRGPQTPITIIQLPELFIPNDSQQRWSYIREAQANAAAFNSGVNLVPALGTGIKNNLHPPDKRRLAHRVALQLEKTLAGKPSITPQLSGITSLNGAIKLVFVNTGQGLKSNQSQITGFSIADESGKNIPVKAALINKNTVEIALPFSTKELRYAWGNYPEFSLYNSMDIPVPAFRLIAN